MQKSNKVLGILVGVVARHMSAYRYVVIPKNTTDIDVLWTILPDNAKLHIVESSTVFVAFLEGLYVGEFYYKTSILYGYGLIHKAIPGGKLKLVRIDIDNPLSSLKNVDDKAEYYLFQEPPIVDSVFLTNLSRSIGTSIVLPTRFMATQLATRVYETDTTMVMNFREAYSWMKRNPHKLRGIAILPSFYLGIIVADPVTKEELKKDIALKINESVSEFESDYIRLLSLPGSESYEIAAEGAPKSWS